MPIIRQSVFYFESQNNVNGVFALILNIKSHFMSISILIHIAILMILKHTICNVRFQKLFTIQRCNTSFLGSFHRSYFSLRFVRTTKTHLTIYDVRFVLTDCSHDSIFALIRKNSVTRHLWNIRPGPLTSSDQNMTTGTR